jgi:hypothetical protein
MRHNKWHIEFARVVVAILLGLDMVASSDNEHIEWGNLKHHVLLVVVAEARVTFLAKRPLIFNVLNVVLVLNLPIVVDVQLVLNVLFIIDLDDAFDFKDTDQQVFEELDLDLLLDNDEQSVL